MHIFPKNCMKIWFIEKLKSAILLKINWQISDRDNEMLGVSEWVSSFLTAHQHILGYSMLGSTNKTRKQNSVPLMTVGFVGWTFSAVSVNFIPVSLSWIYSKHHSHRLLSQLSINHHHHNQSPGPAGVECMFNYLVLLHPVWYHFANSVCV